MQHLVGLKTLTKLAVVDIANAIHHLQHLLGVFHRFG